MTNDDIVTTKSPSRPLFLRIIFGVLWFIPIYFLVNILVGGVIGAMAGASTTEFTVGYNSGYSASVAFFQKYGLVILLFDVLLTLVLSATGVLPWTGKYRRSEGK